MDLWQLPTTARLGDTTYDIHADFRDILEIFAYFQDGELPEFVRWEIALRLFYEQPIPECHRTEAQRFLTEFINCGAQPRPGPRLLDWKADAMMIVADVNKVAMQEIRSLPFVHWWTFLGWFHAIGQGQLSTVVSIRDKLYRGKKLEDWERDFYRDNKERIDLPRTVTVQELAQRERLNKLLGA